MKSITITGKIGTAYEVTVEETGSVSAPASSSSSSTEGSTGSSS